MDQPPKKTPGSKWQSLKRCLLIIQRLQQGPATKRELIQAVQLELPQAYQATTASASNKRFDKDLERIRQGLIITISYDRKTAEYTLVDLGPYLGIDLAPGALRGLAFLLATFEADDPANELVQMLLTTIQQRLSYEQMRQLTWQTPELELGLKNLDKADINAEVWHKVRQARRRKVVLRFNYMANPPTTIEHTVEPHYLYLKEGHYVLLAYCRRWVAPDRSHSEAGWLEYRLTSIQPDLQILPDKFSSRQPKRASITVTYRLSPKIHRQGKVSARLEDMKVSPIEADGWVTVIGKTDNLFRTRRILLSYGENCQVLAPPELRRQFAEAAQKMAKFYEDS